jgi:hypothetical protein
MSSDPRNLSLPAPSSPAGATQLKDLPMHDLRAMARDFGVSPMGLETKPALVAAILDRRTLIASMDREALVDVLTWAHRPVSSNMGRDAMAIEIVKCKSMRFSGLSQRGLIALAKLRGIEVKPDDATPDIISKLKGHEGLFAKLARKRRSFMGKMVSRMLGEGEEDVPRQLRDEQPATAHGAAAAERKLHEEIEESGLIAGLTSRVRKTADTYLNQKLDEIEARIDRKLDEIDRRLAEWRDKEVANRIRILKISLWATVVVGGVTLIISYIRVYMPWIFGG